MPAVISVLILLKLHVWIAKVLKGPYHWVNKGLLQQKRGFYGDRIVKRLRKSHIFRVLFTMFLRTCSHGLTLKRKKKHQNFQSKSNGFLPLIFLKLNFSRVRNEGFPHLNIPLLSLSEGCYWACITLMVDTLRISRPQNLYLMNSLEYSPSALILQLP